MDTELDSRIPTLRRAAQAEPLGLYLHVPFCVDRCSYCSFASTQDHSQRGQVLARLGQDLETWGTRLGRPAVDTLYLGGGTPSVLTGEELAALSGKVRAAFDLADLQEATLEANPGTLSPDWLRRARDLGWDRISLGIQTLDDALLRRLGRIHDAEEGLTALAWAREAGFGRISADLMIGIPGQDLSRLLADARRLVEAGARHLSVYMLDLDKACPLKTQVEAGLLALPSEDEVADAYEALQELLPTLGLLPYEISNHAAPGEHSLHNTRYWQRRPYLGLGPGAASQLDRWRWAECWDISAWAAGATPPEVQELTPAESLAEIPLLGLRMLRGISWDGLRSRAAEQELLPLVEGWEQALEPFLRHGLLERQGAVLRFTRKGLLLSNSVLEIFV